MVILAFVHEVMGKGPARGDIWLFFLGAGIIGFVLSRRRVASLLVTLPVIAFLCWLRMTELRDPRVGPDILREAGRSYFIHCYGAMASAVLLPAAGGFGGRVRRRKFL